MSTHDILTNVLSLTVREERGMLTTLVPRERFAEVIDELVNCRSMVTMAESGATVLNGSGLALSALYATDDRLSTHTFGVHAVLHDDTARTWLVVSAALPENDPSFPSVTRLVMAAHWYERYISDMFGIAPVGHPDLRRFVHHENVPEQHFPLRKDFVWNAKMEQADVPYPLPSVEGDGVCEVPLGPVQASLAEAGHYRFTVVGERIISLESKPFFTHKGVEKLLEGKTLEQALPFVERVSGDAAVSHALAFAQAIETLAGVDISQRAAGLRTLVNELERATMHVGDLADIVGNGTEYVVGGAQGFRLKERLVRLSEELLGNRFWRGFVVPGGVSKDLNANELQRVAEVATKAIDEMTRLAKVFLHSDGLRDRLETTGVLSTEAARAYGAVGVAARASGVDRDVRRDHPHAGYGRFVPMVIKKTGGDVYARVMQRFDELQESRRLIAEICKGPGEGRHRVDCAPRNGMGIGVTEGWRGETLHVVRLKDGLIDRHVVRDPSFCNGSLLSEMTPGDTLSDFSLIQTSLNLSSSGIDL